MAANNVNIHPRTHRFASSSSSTSSSSQQQQQQQQHSFLWLSDLHLDPNYSTPSAYRYPDGRYDAIANCTSLNANSDRKLGMHGCDSPLALVQSTFDAAISYFASLSTTATTTSQQQPDFILITGDVVRHGTTHYESAQQILSTIAYEITAKFPNVEVIYAVGNNDVVPDYYLRLPSDEIIDDKQTGDGGDDEEKEGSGDSSGESDPSTLDKNINMLEVIYNSLIGQESTTKTTASSMISTRKIKAILAPDDKNTFLTGGYYSRYLHSDKSLLVLSMNTVLYSAILEPPRNDADPGMQFSWMRAMLSSCRNSNSSGGNSNSGNINSSGGCRAIIAGHIPPTVGSYKFNQLWKAEYVRTYYDIVQEYDEIIIGQLFGHLHTDEFRVGGIFAETENNTSKDNDGNEDILSIPSSISTPLLLGASVSPLHGNDPSFRLVMYDAAGGGKKNAHHRLVDFESHAYSLSTRSWSKLYTFSEAYGDVLSSDILKKEGLSSTVFRTVGQSMEDDITGEGENNNKPTKKEESSTLKQYRTYMLSGAEGDAFNRGANVDCDSACRDEFVCTLQSATRAGYDNCLLGKKESRRADLMAKEEGLIGLVVAGIVVIVVMSIVIVRCRKRQCLRASYDSPPSIHEEEAGIDLKDKEMI